jgi:hypothetical protein
MRTRCPSRRVRARLFLLIASGLATPIAHAAIVIDGRLDEPEWRDAARYDDFRVVAPYRLSPAPDGAATVAHLLSTADGLVVGFTLAQSAAHPRIRPRLERDQDTRADRIGVMIDFDADGRTAYSFGVDLSGSVQDGVVTNENQLATDWDTDWTWAVSEDAGGWQVELLLPWTVAMMRGADTPTRDIAVHFSRTLGATGEQLAYPAASIGRARFVSAFERVNVAQYRKALLHVWPYATVTHDRIAGGQRYKAGVDVLWKPSPTFQLGATVNPDFGQVESDDLVISFDAVETFQSDRRPFFTENQSIFERTTPDAGRLVHTRRIGAEADDGTGAADIAAAIKLSGSLGALGYGLLSASERGPAGRDFHAARLQYPVSTGLNIGWLGTYVRRPFLHRDARVQAIDLSWRRGEQLVIDAQALASATTQQGTTRRGAGAWLRMFWMPSSRWTYELEATHFGRGLDFNDLGYQRRGDLDELEVTGAYLHRSDDDASRLSTARWSLEAQARRNHDGERLPNVAIARGTFDLRSGSQIVVDGIVNSGGWDDRFLRGQGAVWFGRRHEASASLTSRRFGAWSYEADLTLSALGLGARPSPAARVAVNWFASDTFNAKLELAPDTSQDWLIWKGGEDAGRYTRRGDALRLDAAWFPGRQHELRLKSEWLGLRAEAGRRYRRGADGRLHATGETLPAFDINRFGIQLRYRYLLGPQSDVYLAWSRGGLGEHERRRPGTADLLDEALSLADADQLVAKLRYRF